MFRKFATLFNKELFRVSSQHSKVLSLANKDGASNITRNSKSPEEHTKHQKRANQNFQKIKAFIDQYQKNFNGRARMHDVKEDFVVWCTGVLTISSAIVGHKWFNRGQQQNCPLRNVSRDSLQNFLFEPISRSHAVLAINPHELPKQKPQKEETSDVSKEAKLDALFEIYQSTTDECSGKFLNELGIKYGKSNKYQEAFAMFKEASTLGNVSAFYNMAISYEKGVGINRSYIEAADYYKRAGDGGHAKALYNLSSLYYSGLLGADKVKNGFEYARKAADLGLSKAQLFVGLRFAEQKEWCNSVRYFKMAAEQQDPSAIYNLAICYERGLGTKQKKKKALELYREAADHGHTLSQFYLGECYQNGQLGLSENLEEALEWFKQAARSGHPDAKSRVEYIEYEIDQKNEDELLTLFESNRLLQVLEPIQKVVQSSSFHKSASMPSLQKLCTNHPLQSLLVEQTSINGSTSSLCL